MRLPKWVVKWVKDDFTLEKAEHKIKQQELEIEKLKRQLARQRFFNLPKEEVEWVARVFKVLWSSILNSLFGGWRQENKFIMDYLEQRDIDEKEKLDQMYESWDLPF